MNELETQVLEYIGENTTTPDVFVDTSTGMAPIRESLCDAIEEISMITGSNKREYHLPLEQDSNFYRLAWNQDVFAWITDAWLVGQKRRLEHTDLIRLNNHNPRWLRNTGPPHSYFPIGTNIVGVWPRTTSDTDIIALTCVAIPDRYTEDTDRIKLRNDYQWAAVFYAVSEFWASRGDAKTATYFHTMYLDKLGLQNLYPASAEYVPGYKTNKEQFTKATD